MYGAGRPHCQANVQLKYAMYCFAWPWTAQPEVEKFQCSGGWPKWLVPIDRQPEESPGRLRKSPYQ
jgi:hypothetical protein